MKCNKFWLENPNYLLCDLKLIPKPNMTLEEQMNCISRLVILTFLMLYLIGYKQSVLFLILSIIFIIILYYLQKNKMTTCENFTPIESFMKKTQNVNNYDSLQSYIQNTHNLNQQAQTEFVKNRYTVDKFPTYYNQQVGRFTEIKPDQLFISSNQKLVGGANPKTKIAPINVAPIYEWSYWKDNDFVFPSAVNERTIQDYYQSGYYVESYDYPPVQENKKECDQIVENFSYQKSNKDYKNNSKENFIYIGSAQDTDKSCRSCALPNPYGNQIQLTNGDFSRFEQKLGDEKRIRYTGDVNASCGYDETNLQYNLPANYNANNCQRTQSVSKLNDEIFTSTVTPGVYYKNEIIEPLNWNIGISFDQQIPPRKVSYDKEGDKIYTAMDPRLYTPVDSPSMTTDVPSNYDVFDPRSNGYGTQYRSYVDKMTGRPRFFYDDVDAIRKPNYITRSKIDVLPGADTYGPVKSDQEIEDTNANIRLNADMAFRDQTLDFRTDLMTRLMRKKNAEIWQNRMAPRSGKQFTMGSKRC